MEDKSKGLVLIIDDEESIRDGCKQALEKSGYQVLSAGNGNEGITLALKHKPGIAFIDLKMPGMSGMDIIEILSKDAPDIILVVITGYASIVSAVESIKKGAYDYLPKPFTPDQIRVVASRGLDHRMLKMEAKNLREEKERMEKNFITFVSHEMRSPLVTIRQYIEALKAVTGESLNEDAINIIEQCNKRIQKLEDLVERWLDISRIDSNMLSEKIPINLSDIISSCVEETDPLCRRENISLATDTSATLPSIMGDKESLVRVFVNLISNATKYTPAEGNIFLKTAFDGSYITVSVSDSGTGIPKEKLPFIFEPFYRARGKEERHRGSGLGLTFCKKIVEAHGGKIEVESSEGKGTTFFVKFPRIFD